MLEPEWALKAPMGQQPMEANIKAHDPKHVYAHDKEYGSAPTKKIREHGKQREGVAQDKARHGIFFDLHGDCPRVGYDTQVSPRFAP